MEDKFISKVISGEEQKNGDVHVTYLIAEGDLINKMGNGFSSDLLRKWHKLGSWKDIVHNVHISRNHPLRFFNAPKGLTESALINAYKAESEKWGIGRFLETKLVEMANGAARLLGIVKLYRTAKEMWKKGKFPLYSSSSVYATEEKNGLVTDGIPISNTSVDEPAYGIELAKTHGECEGGSECVTKLLENSENGLCQNTISILDSFKNNFSSHSGGKLHESSMGENDGSSQDSATDVKPAIDGTQETTSAENQESKTGNETENIEELRAIKAKFLEMEPKFKELTKKSKADDEYRADTDKRLKKIETEKVESKVRNLIEKIPVSFFDNKEDKREEAITSTMKLYGKLTEDELIGFVKDKYSVLEKMIQVSQKKNNQGLKENSFISNNAPAGSSSDADKKNSGLSILDAHKLVGSG